jgi:XTP/dITP diphosphohydrolase
MKLLIATNNKGKQSEFKKFFADKNVKIIFPKDLKIKDEPEETGTTFAENSLIKAKWYFEKTGICSISDDAGMIIPILNNEPGIKSRRWLGREATDKELIDYTLERLREFKYKSERVAYFQTVITYFDGKNIVQTDGKVEGFIPNKAHGFIVENYPYRSVLIVNGPNKYYNDLTDEEHLIYNHRMIALDKMWQKLKKIV